MSCFKAWLSLATISPPVLALLVVLLLVPEQDTGGPSLDSHRDRHADQDTDETVALQKIGLQMQKPNKIPWSSPEYHGLVPSRLIKNKKILKELPKAPKRLPDSLRGVFWLDQSGAYGLSSLPVTADDLCINFCKEHSEWDPVRRVMRISPISPCWQWFNSLYSYLTGYVLTVIQFVYQNTYSEDFKFAQTEIIFTLPLVGGKYFVPISVVNFTQRAPDEPLPGECPPPKNATKRDRNKCAQMIRYVRILEGFPLLSESFGESKYPVFRVSDEDHNPLEPYYSEYLKYADKVTEPDPVAATILLGVTWADLRP